MALPLRPEQPGQELHLRRQWTDPAGRRGLAPASAIVAARPGTSIARAQRRLGLSAPGSVGPVAQAERSANSSEPFRWARIWRDEQVSRNPRAETRIDSRAGIGGRYGSVPAVPAVSEMSRAAPVL
jgi:hypothetical protein